VLKRRAGTKAAEAAEAAGAAGAHGNRTPDVEPPRVASDGGSAGQSG
jgi:hypothetical protein